MKKRPNQFYSISSPASRPSHKQDGVRIVFDNRGKERVIKRDSSLHLLQPIKKVKPPKII